VTPVVLAERLGNQRLIGSKLETPAAIVDWLGAVQAQEYGPAKWGVGQRAPGLAEADIDRAFNDGAILRTHVMRPTWHFATPRDLRWMLALTAPHINTRMASYNRKLSLDARLFAQSHDALARALEGGRFLTRTQLSAALAWAGIKATAEQLGHLMMQAELDQVVCSGPRRGKQFTYALLSERVPRGRTLSREDAVVELARRYLRSHGPATARDFAWWSGLPMADVRRGLDAAGRAVDVGHANGPAYWASRETRSAPAAHRAYLLPVYDEYLIAYKDRHLTADSRIRDLDPSSRDDFGHYLVIDGRFAGTWRWVPSADGAVARVMPYRPLSVPEQRAVRAAGRRLSDVAASSLSVEFR
jgi:hypothetical protein